MSASPNVMTRVPLIFRPMLWVAVLAGLAAWMLILLCTLMIADAKRDTDRQADQAAANIVDSIQKDIARNFEIFDLSLQGVITALQQPEFAALTGRVRQLALFDNAINASYLNGIIVLDENGDIIDDAHSILPRKANFADREFFRAQRDNPNLGLFLSGPAEGPLNGDRIVAISRRITKPDGSFGGVVSGSVQLAYFQSLFTNLSIGPHGTIALFQDNGQLVARQPFQAQAISKDFKHTALFRAYQTTKSGRFESSVPLDGLARRYTFGQVGKLPLVVSVGFAIEDIYAPWRQKMYLIGALMAVLSLTIIALAIVLFREYERRKRADALLRASEVRYRLLADTSSDAIVLRDPEGRRTYASPAFYRIIGRTREEMADRSLSEHLDTAARTTRLEVFKRLRAGEEGVVELLHYIHPNGSQMWLESISSAMRDENGQVTEIVTNVRDVTDRKLAQDALTIAATTDELTGLANRRCFEKTILHEWKRAIRSQSNIAVLMIDVDFFKTYNDTFGHLRGDDALRLVAECINSTIQRPDDLAARYGGEEFVVILPGTDAAGALHVAERIRHTVLNLALNHPKSNWGVVTVSVGLTHKKVNVGDDVVDVIQAADTALYMAKKNGRNRTEWWISKTADELPGERARLA